MTSCCTNVSCTVTAATQLDGDLRAQLQNHIFVLDREVIEFREYHEQKIKEFSNLKDLEIRNLRSQQNRLTPASRLPSELLCIVFMFCVRCRSSSKKKIFDLIAITHVCQTWRNVALQYPSLWSCPVFSYPTWAALMLERSGDALLSVGVQCTWRSPRIAELVPVALQHIARISELRLNVEDQTYKDCSEELLPYAPQLHTLHLGRCGRALGARVAHILPSLLLGGRVLPLLRDLELTACPVPWNSPLFTDLTRLALRHFVVPEERPSLEDIATILHSLRDSLRILEMDFCLPESLAAPIPETIPILQLPSLSSLSLSSNGLESYHLHTHIRIPPDATLRLVCGSRNDSETESAFDPVIPAVFRWIDSPSQHGPRQPKQLELLRIYLDVILSIRFVGRSSLPKDFDVLKLDASLTEPNLDVVFSSTANRSFFGGFTGIITSVCHELPLLHLQVLDIRIYSEFTGQTWIDIFGSLPQLNTLCLQSPIVGPLITAIGTNTINEPEALTTEAPAFFTQLRHLAFRGGEFTGGWHTPCLKRLEQSLVWRNTHGMSIESLRFCACSHVDSQDISHLRQYVHRVQLEPLVWNLEKE